MSFMAGVMAKVVEYLPGKNKTKFKPQHHTTKKKKKKGSEI
jgi:hypothetical protein